MHYKTKESAVAKYLLLVGSSGTDFDLKAAITQDEKAFQPDEVEEIFAEVGERFKQGHKVDSKGAEKSAMPTFDYRNLMGEEFDKYIAYVNSLQWNDKRDFGLYPAEGIYKPVLNDNLDKVLKLVGVRLKDQQPKHFTRIPVKDAKDLNAQLQQNTAANTAFYYLLKQPV